MVSFFPSPGKSIANYTAIQLEMNPETKAQWGKMSNNMLESADKEEAFSLNIPRMIETMFKINRDTYADPLVKRLIAESQFDLVIFGWFFNDYQLGFASHFKCPAVVVASMSPFKIHHNLVGNPTGAAFIPVPVLALPTPMNFKHRLLNFGMDLLEGIVFGAVDRFLIEPEYRRNFPPESFPSYHEAKKNVALMLVASHFSQEGPVVSFPSMVEVSGMHVKKTADPLPQVNYQVLVLVPCSIIIFLLHRTFNTGSTQPKMVWSSSVLVQALRVLIWQRKSETLSFACSVALSSGSSGNGKTTSCPANRIT